MKALLIKDFFNIKEQLKFYLILLVFYGGFSAVSVNTGAFSGIMLMFILIMLINTMSYDERAKWDSFCLATPISRKVIVLEKYTIGLILFAVLGVISTMFLMIFEDSFGFVESTMCTLAIETVAIIMVSLILPIVFKLGVEKGRIVMIAVMLIPVIIVFAAPFAAEMKALNWIDISKINIDLLVPIGLVIAFVMYGISAMLSIKFYNKKEF